jgi:hypothetical protein
MFAIRLQPEFRKPASATTALELLVLALALLHLRLRLA